MVEKERYLIVVSVLEGRKFPKRSKHQLVVEAKFDGELLATDPVDHVENVDFTQELAWELDKKALHQHRLQRTSVKVQVYAVDTQSTMKEVVGYVVLDIRSAHSQQTCKWLPLLNSKYHKSKPEIKIGLYLDDDKSPIDQPGFKAKEAPARKAEGISGSPGRTISDLDAASLKPVLNDIEGYYQIGSENSCKENFVLSVTVAFAANIPQLIPVSVPLPDTGFFFYYSLLGNDVTNEPFYDILNPSFPAERASVRIRSSVDILRAFFVHQPGLLIHLCCGDQSLGSTEISLQSLLKKESTEIYMKPVSIEGAFQIFPPSGKVQKVPVPDDLKPSLGVSVTLRKEDVLSASGTPVKEKVQSKTDQAKIHDGKAASPKVPQTSQGKHREESTPEKASKGPQKKKAPSPSPERRPRSHSPPPTHDGSYTDTFESEEKGGKHEDESRKDLPQKKPEIAGATQKEETTPQVVAHGAASSSLQTLFPSPIQAHGPYHTAQPAPISGVMLTSVPPQGSTEPCHFTCSIDLRSFKATDVSHPINIFLRYTYPFFGSASPIFTHPAVEARKNAEVYLNKSFCAFDFATSPQQIRDTFHSMPLLVEVWDKDRQRSDNKLVGVCQLSLVEVLLVEKARAVHQSGKAGWRQIWSERLPVFHAEKSVIIGELLIMVTLEDWGPISQVAQPEPISSSSDTTSANPAPNKQQEGPGEAEVVTDPRETVEYKMALELEMWKEQQETVFQSQLKDKERQYMHALAEEWKKRDKEREVVTQKKVAECRQLEEKLSKTLNDLDKRDKQLAANEQEVLRLRNDLQREHERKMTDMREASQRMKEDCNHQIALANKKNSELEDYIARLKNQISDLEAKNQGLEREFEGYKQQERGKPELRLQSELNVLTLEKVELERKLDGATKSKVHYKQQWGRALKELARLKQREQQLAKAQLKKQQQELDHMRLRYLAAEEKEVVEADKKELEEIKKELQLLKEKELSKSDGSGIIGMTSEVTTGENEEEDDHITRLIEERDTLLRTGVYNNDDRIITELDRQIREAIGSRGREQLKSSIIRTAYLS